MSWGSSGSGIARTRRLRWVLRRADGARDQREYAKAARLYQNALALDPRRADTRLQLGQMFRELARFGEAEAAFRQVLAQSPQNREAQLQLAQLLSLLGREGEETATPPLVSGLRADWGPGIARADRHRYRRLRLWFKAASQMAPEEDLKEWRWA